VDELKLARRVRATDDPNHKKAGWPFGRTLGRPQGEGHGWPKSQKGGIAEFIGCLRVQLHCPLQLWPNENTDDEQLCNISPELLSPQKGVFNEFKF